MKGAQILPGTGRGTATRSGVVEGLLWPVRFSANPSTIQLRWMVPLPVPGRI